MPTCNFRIILKISSLNAKRVLNSIFVAPFDLTAYTKVWTDDLYLSRVRVGNHNMARKTNSDEKYVENLCQWKTQEEFDLNWGRRELSWICDTKMDQMF